MVISSDIVLKGSVWRRAVDIYKPFFKERTQYDVFLVSTAIGVMYDRRKSTVDDKTDTDPVNIPRTVFNSRSTPFEHLLKSAILTTETETLDDEKRLRIAFSGEDDFNVIQFLIEFANFGVEKLIELQGVNDLEIMENVKNFLVNTVEDSNYEINEISPDIIAETVAEYSAT